MKITKKQLRKLILEELTRATPAEVVMIDDVATPAGVAEHIQNIYTILSNIESQLYDKLKGYIQRMPKEDSPSFVAD